MSNIVAQLSAERRRREERRESEQRIAQIEAKIRKLFIKPQKLMVYLNTLDLKFLCNLTETKKNEMAQLRLTDLLLTWLKTICLNQFGALQQTCKCYQIDELKQRMDQLNKSQRDYLKLRILIDQSVNHEYNRKSFESIFGEESKVSEVVQISIWAQFVQEVMKMGKGGGLVPHLEFIMTEVMDRRSKRIDNVNKRLVQSWEANRQRHRPRPNQTQVPPPLKKTKTQSAGGGGRVSISPGAQAELFRQQRRSEQYPRGPRQEQGQSRKRKAPMCDCDEVCNCGAQLKMSFIHNLC